MDRAADEAMDTGERAMPDTDAARETSSADAAETDSSAAAADGGAVGGGASDGAEGAEIRVGEAASGSTEGSWVEPAQDKPGDGQNSKEAAD
jgi:hypothetical protein